MARKIRKRKQQAEAQPEARASATKRSMFIVLGAAAFVALVVALIGAVVTEPSEVGRADPNDAQQVALGKIAYDQNCAVCHGGALQGEPNWRSPRRDGTLPAPPHDESGHTWHHADQLLFEITKNGGAAYSPKSRMPGFGEILSDDEIWAVLAYIKSTWPPAVQERQRQITLASD